MKSLPAYFDGAISPGRNAVQVGEKKTRARRLSRRAQESPFRMSTVPEPARCTVTHRQGDRQSSAGVGGGVTTLASHKARAQGRTRSDSRNLA